MSSLFLVFVKYVCLLHALAEYTQNSANISFVWRVLCVYCMYFLCCRILFVFACCVPSTCRVLRIYLCLPSSASLL